MKKITLVLLQLSSVCFAQQSTAVMANSFFEDGNPANGKFVSSRTSQQADKQSSQRVNDVIYGLIDDNTNEQTSFSKVTTYKDGSNMSAAKVDGVIYRMKGTEYFRRVFMGPVNVRWFGAKGNGVTDDTKAIQKAIDLFEDVYIPKGQYQVSGIVLSKRGASLRGDGRGATILYAAGVQEFVVAVKSNTKPADIIENVHIADLKIDGGYKSKVGLRTSIIMSTFERIDISSCNEFGILHYRGFTSTYRDISCLYCGVAGLKIFQEGNLLLFERCVFGLNKGSGILYYSGTTTMFLSCSIENNQQYGVLLTYQSDPSVASAPYVTTTVGILSFTACFFEQNGASNKTVYSNITINGQPDPGPAKVLNIVVKGCHFGLSKGERAIDLRADMKNVTIEDNMFAFNEASNTPPVIIGSFYLNNAKRIASALVFRNNILEKTHIEIAGASDAYNKNAVADLLGLQQKAVVTLKGLTFTIYKSSKNVSVYINGTSSSKIDEDINFSATGILLSTSEQIRLSDLAQQGMSFETSPIEKGNVFRFSCAAGKTFNHQPILFTTQY